MSEERKDDESGESDSNKSRSGDEVLRDLPRHSHANDGVSAMAEEINSHSVTSIITLW